LAAGIDRGEHRFRQLLDSNMSAAAELGTAYARANHPWRNQTGDAERLFLVENVNNGLGLRVSHGVFYGVYLEFKNGGRYAVIPAVMQYMGPIVQHAMQDAVEGAGF
jgi:hypothetical protein